MCFENEFNRTTIDITVVKNVELSVLDQKEYSMMPIEREWRSDHIVSSDSGNE